MKRFLLITAGAVGGLGAVLSVTPPQLGNNVSGIGNDLAPLPTADATSQAPVATQSPTSTPTKSTSPVKSNSPKPGNSVTPTPDTSSPAATPTQTQ